MGRKFQKDAKKSGRKNKKARFQDDNLQQLEDKDINTNNFKNQASGIFEDENLQQLDKEEAVNTALNQAIKDLNINKSESSLTFSGLRYQVMLSAGSIVCDLNLLGLNGRIFLVS